MSGAARGGEKWASEHPDSFFPFFRGFLAHKSRSLFSVHPLCGSSARPSLTPPSVIFGTSSKIWVVCGGLGGGEREGWARAGVAHTRPWDQSSVAAKA